MLYPTGTTYHLAQPLYYYRHHRSSLSYDYQIEQILASNDIIAHTCQPPKLGQDELTLAINSQTLSLIAGSSGPPEPLHPSEIAPIFLPLVSIIIPCYNAAPRLAACLQSCIAQTYPNLEILFVDNNSTDSSVEIAQQIAAIAPRPIRLLHCSSKGANYARNHGYSYAQGEYIQWLDADDELAPTKIALQVAALEQDPTHDIACADWEWHYYQTGHLKFRLTVRAQCFPDPLLQGLLHHWHPPHAYLLRRNVAQQLDYLQAWYPGAPIGNDREYFTTAAMISCRFLRVPGTFVRYYTWSDTQLTLSTSYQVRLASMKQVFERFKQRICHTLPDKTSGLHWFLLQQNWDLWKLASIQIKHLGNYCYWLEEIETAIGITLTLEETRIVIAMSQLQSIATIEDHAHQILRLLWRQVVLLPGVTPSTLTIEFAKWVGILPGDCPLTPVKNDSLAQDQLPLLEAIDTIPLYVPMFPSIRLVILQVLDKLRVVGLLRQYA